VRQTIALGRCQISLAGIGQQNDSGIDLPIRELAHDFDAIHSGQLQIHDDDARIQRIQTFEQLNRKSRPLGLVTGFLGEPAQDLKHCRIFGKNAHKGFFTHGWILRSGSGPGEPGRYWK